MEEKKNKIIVVIIGIIVLLIGVILFVTLFNGEKSDNNKNKVENNNEQTQIKDEVVENVKYNNFKDKVINIDIEEINFDSMRLYIENKKLYATANNKQFNITGLTGNIKSFTYNELCSEIPILVINENNEIFSTIIDGENKKFTNNKLVFKKLNTNEKIVDITTHIDLSYSEGCPQPNLAVVLENGEIRSVDYNENKIFSIGTKDYSIYLANLNGNILVLKDGTIKEVRSEEIIKNNGQDFKVDKIYLVKDETENENEYFLVHFYIVSNNKLYKLTLDYSNNKIKDNMVLVSNKNVIKTTTTTKGLTEPNYEEDNVELIKETITFEDNTTKVINADSIYIRK